MNSPVRQLHDKGPFGPLLLHLDGFAVDDHRLALGLGRAFRGGGFGVAFRLPFGCVGTAQDGAGVVFFAPFFFEACPCDGQGVPAAPLAS